MSFQIPMPAAMKTIISTKDSSMRMMRRTLALAPIAFAGNWREDEPPRSLSLFFVIRGCDRLVCESGRF